MSSFRILNALKIADCRMRSTIKTYLLLSLVFITISGCDQLASNSSDEIAAETLFTMLDANQTGISFSNMLQESEEMNILEYLYFYNGGGVATGDINNDGLVDIYFTANQKENKLYLNKGNFKFEDITVKANAQGEGSWKTGVTMADVNADGYLDIYICQVGNYKTFKGKNQLLINNGDLTFTDKASEYGLDFQGFSTQSLFFDYDRDGDLDMYLLNHAVHTENSYGKASLRLGKDSLAGDRLYENRSINNRPLFVDVTEKANIFSSHIGYGLGVGASDFNNDGWVDLYVSNDFHENDYLYINNRDGTFKEQIKSSMPHSSRFSMGMDVGDINNDGLMDVMTLDMLPENEKILKTSVGDDPYNIYEFKLRYGYHYQFARNALQLHQGMDKNAIPQYADVGIMSGVHATDWSWSTLITDLDNDGYNDIYITNGIVRRPNDLDYIAYHYQNFSEENKQTKNKTNNLEMQKIMPSIKLSNFVFQNKKNLRFENKSKLWGLSQPSFSNGASYADLDNDGDLDLVVNNIDESSFVYQNNTEKKSNNYLKLVLHGKGQNTFAIGARVTVICEASLLIKEVQATKGFLSSIDPTLTFGLGKAKKVDSILILWPDGSNQSFTDISINRTIKIEQEKEEAPHQITQELAFPKATFKFEDITDEIGLAYQHKENAYYDFNDEPLIPKLLSTSGPRIAIGDINNDNLDDLYISGASNQPGAVYLQLQNGSFQKTFQPAFLADAHYEDVDASFLDADGDGDLDLIVVNGGNEIGVKTNQLIARLYINKGNGVYEFQADNLPKIKGNGSCVSPNDFDKDGDLDVFIGGRSIPGQYGMSAASYVLINNGNGQFQLPEETLMPGLNTLGMVTDAVWGDLNQDGTDDIAIVGEWMPITIYFNKKGVFEKDEGAETGLKNSEGWWNTISLTDIDNDGDNDLIAGNLGLNSKIKADSLHPAQLYVTDFDKNGKIDPILCYFKNGISYPAVSRDKLLNQINNLKSQFTSYAAFGDSRLEQIFSKEQIDQATIKEAKNMATSIIKNEGSGRFSIKSLPWDVQVAPINSIVVHDFDGDKVKDIFLAGNFYGVEPDVGRYDASKGHLLFGVGNGNFKVGNNQDLNLFLNGEVRDMKILNSKNDVLIIAKNNEPLQFLKLK